MKVIENQTFDMERALYGCNGIAVRNCSFDGPADGESAFKEGEQIEVSDCFFNLRYLFWHDRGLTITDSEMTQGCRAALWYCDQVEIADTKLHGIKALRECSNVLIRNCDIISPEFGWSVRGIRMEDTTAVSEYFMMRSEDLTFRGVISKTLSSKTVCSIQRTRSGTEKISPSGTAWSRENIWHGIPTG